VHVLAWQRLPAGILQPNIYSKTIKLEKLRNKDKFQIYISKVYIGRIAVKCSIIKELAPKLFIS
jgi:hypothetical protein